MPKIKPFDGYLINEARAGAVVSPAYDAVSAEQRRQFAAENPQNFINTMRLQEDFPADAQPTQSELLAANKESLYALLEDGSFQPFQPSMFVYQLGTDDHCQTGLVCEVSVTEYENGSLRKHENTRRDKEDLLARYQEVVGASSSPICLTYPQHKDIDTLIDEITGETPALDFTTEDGETQKIWAVSESSVQNKLQSLFAQVDATYLTDGHHRAASGCRYAEIMREKTNAQTGHEPFNQLLIALFPDNQLNLLPFHRCVKDIALSPELILAGLEKNFTVKALTEETGFTPEKHGEFGMLLENTWYHLNVKSSSVDQSNPVAALDVSILQNLILDPVLGVKDMREDPRLGYIAGVSGPTGIQEAIAEGCSIVFTCYPTSIRQLMDVADADGLMPPKSTYFDPKPRSGIFVRLK